MAWRINIDESKYSNEKKLAWHFVFPHRHLYILDSDYEEVKKVEKFLTAAFSKQALAAAVRRLDI